MRRYYYVDTENLKYTEFMPFFEDVTKQDTILLMVSDQSAKIPIYEVVEKFTNLCNKCSVKCIRVQNGEPNALDFCLVSVMGRYVQKAPKSKHIILSKDKGYDAVVEMLSSEGICVVRYSGAANITVFKDKYGLEELPIELQNEWKRKLQNLRREKASTLKRESYNQLVNAEYAKLCEKYRQSISGNLKQN